MKNERFSPKTYIQTVLYDKVEIKRAKLSHKKNLQS